MRFLCLFVMATAFFGFDAPKNIAIDFGAEISTDTVPWEILTVSDTVFFEEDNPSEDGMLNYDVSIPFIRSSNPAFNKMLNDSIYAFVGEAGVITNEGYKAAYEECSKLVAEEYFANADENPGDIIFEYYVRSYVSKGKVLLNEPQLFTASVEKITYKYYRLHLDNAYWSFALNPTRYLGYAQIFDPTENPARISALLSEYVTDRSQLYQDRDSIPVTKNVGLTREGVVFVYKTYEIGPEESGVIEITLPYARLKKEKLLSPEVAKLVADL